MTIPLCFVDRFPWRGPWIDASTPPEPLETPSLLFADGHTQHGTWIPARDDVPAGWWGFDQEQKRNAWLHPIGWRLMEQAHNC